MNTTDHLTARSFFICLAASLVAVVTAAQETQLLSVSNSPWRYLANGSNQNMGLWNVFVTTTLKNTGPNYYVIGTCP